MNRENDEWLVRLQYGAQVDIKYSYLLYGEQQCVA